MKFDRLAKFWNEPHLTRLLRDKTPATAIEYGLIAAGISVAIIAVVQGLGTKLKVALQGLGLN